MGKGEGMEAGHEGVGIRGWGMRVVQGDGEGGWEEGVGKEGGGWVQRVGTRT